MSRFRLGLAVAVMFALAGPTASLAASAPAVTKEARAQGMKEAPALITAANADCQLADARHIGDGTDTTTKAKESLYEVACTGGEGFIIQKTGDQVKSFTCLSAATPRPDGKPNPVTCILPGNADPKAGFVPFIAAAKISCTPDAMRAMGATADSTYVEVACHDNGGYILKTSNPPKVSAPVTAIPCLQQEGSNLSCSLTTHEAQLAVVDRLSQASGKPCAIKERGYLGATQDGRVLFEEACQDGKGFVLIEAANGGLDKAVPCADADTLLGGCKLTNSRAAKTEEAALYSGLAKKAGYNCDVAAYAILPPSQLTQQMAPNDEYVEISCKNGAPGGVAIFPASGAGTVYDCVRAELIGYRCNLAKTADSYPRITADLKALGKNSCTVSNARSLGLTPDRRGYVEVACSDGLPGYMIEYKVAVPGEIAATTTVPCASAGGIGNGCVLPGNATKKS